MTELQKISTKNIGFIVENLTQSEEKLLIVESQFEKFYRQFAEFLCLFWKNLDINIKEFLIEKYPNFFEKLDLEIESFFKQFDIIENEFKENLYNACFLPRDENKYDLKNLEKLKELLGFLKSLIIGF